jgi:hypothetical protein
LLGDGDGVFVADAQLARDMGHFEGRGGPWRGAPTLQEISRAIMRPIFQRVIREYGGVATEAMAARAS